MIRRNSNDMRVLIGVFSMLCFVFWGGNVYALSGRPVFDVVLQGGRVIDPETGFDAVRHVGIVGGRIQTISRKSLTGLEMVDVSGLVVAPGFIDLHAHGQDQKANALQAQDGVTTALELEAGTLPIAESYAARAGKSILNYGYSVSHLIARTQILTGMRPTSFAQIAAMQPANTNQVDEIVALLEQGLYEGALGIGFGLEYSPGAGRAEVYRIFAAAAQRGVPIFVHARRAPAEDPAPEPALQQVQELIANASATGASVHICHITSTATKDTAIVLDLIENARSRGVDVTTEAYPYIAGSTGLGSALFMPGWRKRLGGLDYNDVVWVATGERLTEATFNTYRAQAISAGPGMAIIYLIPPAAMDMAITHPGVIIASDGLPWTTGLEHPRGAGSFSRVLGRYVRERGSLDLAQALAKMTILPAKRLEDVAPQMKRKGRLQQGADADITVFDPARVIDKATYQAPMQASEGIEFVMVNGIFVVRDGDFIDNVFPGQAVRGGDVNGVAP